MRKTVDINEKIAVRAYFAWQNGSIASAEANWLEAEAIEIALAERRATAATKAAEPRKANRIIKAPIAALATKRRPAASLSTAH